MGWQGQLCMVLMVLHGLLVSVQCISRQGMFPFGPSAGDQALGQGNDQTEELTLEKPVLFYSGKYDKIYINTNGLVAMEEPTAEAEYLGNMPASFSLIAALQGNLDTSDGVGKVYFRQDSSPSTLQQAANHINRAFPEDNEVNPSHMLVVTWVDVAAHSPQRRVDSRRNTFQLVVASLERASYAILLYPREGMQFHSTDAGGTSYTNHAGFSKGQDNYFLFKRQGPYYRISDDEESSIQALAEQTNSGKRGVWVYEIGTSPYFSDVAPGEVPDLSHESSQQSTWEGVRDVPSYPGRQHQVEGYPPYQPGQEDVRDGRYREEQLSRSFPGPIHLEPVQFQPQQPRYQPDDRQVVVVEDGDIDVDVFTYNLETCASNRQKCSTFADCRDYPSGYCCYCRPGFYGNGKDCVAEGKPQRMNGRVSGRVFVGNSPSPVEFSGNDLHAYVVSNDGRAYVAISGIPHSVGFSFQPLSSIGGTIGWAFALQQPGFKNGFSVVGGEFTRQAEVTFLPGSEKLTIKQEFQGINEHDHLVVDTRLDGRVPEVPRGATVQIDSYSEVYQYSNNLITSSSTRDYTVSLEDGTTEKRNYQWRETITFKGCVHDEAIRAVPSTQMLSVDQVFVMYTVNDKLIRYAMTNKIGDVNGGQPGENACFTGRHGCDTNAVCRPGQGNQFTCECTAGFNGDGQSCYDIDECRETPQICGPNAICNNQPGTFRCECMEGFQFASDGQTCIEVSRPVNPCLAGTHDCDVPERARCSYTGGSAYICSCLQGFVGDGRSCQDVDECQPGRCHENAICYNTPGSYTCQCRPGFYGDGFQCSSEREKTRCESQRESVLASTTQYGPRGPRPVPGLYVPTCDAQGAYEPTQCHGSIGQCWCVDRDGLEIAGTRTGPGSQPMCFDQGGVLPPVGPTPRPDVYPLPPGTHILFAQSGKIEFIPLEGYDMKANEAKTALHLPEKVVIGVAYDCVEKMVYWTDITTPSISKADLKGGEPVALIRSDLGSPEGIAVDHLSRAMFWTDSTKDRIEVASLDGAQRRVLVDSDLVNPRAIIVDQNNGYLYWADWNREAPKIETAHMDGTNRRILAKDDLGLPNGLTYDSQTSLLCWADAGTHKVECMNPNQSGRRMVMEGVQYPFGMTAHGKNLYYTDWRRNAVVVVDRYAGKETEEFQPQKRTRLYGITTAYAQCPSGQNYCSVNNGGCTHLCLATPTGRSCLCPDNAVGVSCVEREVRL